MLVNTVHLIQNPDDFLLKIVMKFLTKSDDLVQFIEVLSSLIEFFDQLEVPNWEMLLHFSLKAYLVDYVQQLVDILSVFFIFITQRTLFVLLILVPHFF